MILLDTNVLIALMGDRPLRPAAQDAIRSATPTGSVLVSATTAWEIGLLATRTGRTSQMFLPDGRTWFAKAAGLPGIRLVPFTDEMALDAAYLPSPFHADPSDRWLVATARVTGVPLLTMDRAILAYAESGHLKAIQA